MPNERKFSRNFLISGVSLAILLFLLQATILTQNAGIEQVRHTEYTAFTSSTAGDRGTTAILLHGWRCSASMMAPMARALSKAGFTVFTLELPGHGRSQTAFRIDCPDAGGICVPDSTNTVEVVSSIKKLILAENLANQKIVLIGHSWGGSLGHEALQAAELSMYNLKLINLDGKLNLDALPDERIFSIFVENSLAITEKSASALTKINHLALVSSNEIFQKILQRLGKPADQNPAAIWLPKAATVVILLLLFWSLNFFVQKTQSVPLPESPKVKHIVILFLIAAGVAALFAFGLNSRIHSQFQVFTAARNAIYYYLMLSGILFLAFFYSTGLLSWPKFSLPAIKKIGTLIFFGFLPFPLILFPYIDHYYFHALLTGYRLPEFLFHTALILPLIISLRKIIWSTDPIKIYFLKALCWALLFLTFLLFFHPARVISESVEGLCALLILELFIVRFEYRTGSKSSADGVMALIFGWLITVLFPFLQLPVNSVSN